VKFTDANGKVLTSLRLCAGGIDVVNGVEDSVRSATITITLMQNGKVPSAAAGTPLYCSFDNLPQISGRAVPPRLRNPADAGHPLRTQVPLAVRRDGTALLRVVSSNLISPASLKVHSDSGFLLGTLPCTFGQSFGFRYKGLIATNPQGFAMGARPKPPTPLGVGDEIMVYNSDYYGDYGWEYSPLVLTTPEQVMTATLHLTFQRDLSIDPSADYFLHNGQPVESIMSNADIVNPNLPDAANFVPVPRHRLRIKLTPYREVLSSGAVAYEAVPVAQVLYYVCFCHTFRLDDINNRSATTEVTTNAQGLAVISIMAGERINTCEYFKLQVTDLTQLQ
jgi:hypothetical protein